MTWFLLIVLSLSVFRLTRLTIDDQFPPVRYVREFVTQRDNCPEWLVDLATCHWCASGWIALILTLGTVLFVGCPLPVFMWLASWAIGATLYQIVSKY